MPQQKKVTEPEYRVVFDTEPIFRDKPPLDQLFAMTPVNHVQEFIKGQKLGDRVVLAIPDVVMRERMSQRFKQIQEAIDSIKKKLELLSVFGVSIKQDQYILDYQQLVQKSAEKYIADNNIETLPLNTVSVDELMSRSLEGKKPFSAQGDKGFRDSMIWLSIIDHARQHPDCHYLLVTNNAQDFQEAELVKEFADCSHGILRVFSDVKGLTEYLDEQLSLRLDLKERHATIEDSFKKKLGTLMVALNEYGVTQRNGRTDYFAHEPLYGRVMADMRPTSVATVYPYDTLNRPGELRFGVVGIDRRKRFLGFDYQEGLSVLSIDESEGGGGAYELTVQLNVVSRYVDEEDGGTVSDHFGVTPTPIYFKPEATLAHTSNEIRETLHVTCHYIPETGMILIDSLYS